MTKNTILVELSESEKTQFGREDFSIQSIPQKVFSSIWALESEVYNGGFLQYFQNFSAETSGFVVEALETIGAPETAEICRKAIIAAFPGGLPTDPDKINSDANDFSSEILTILDAFDQDFYRQPNDLTSLLFTYVRLHPEEFGELPLPDEA